MTSSRASDNDVSASITLEPDNGQGLVGGQIQVKGTILQNGELRPGATARITLTGEATFVSSGTNFVDVTADDTGTTPPEAFTSTKETSGNVTFTTTVPAGGEDMKPYAFVESKDKNTMDLSVNPATTPAGEFNPIEAKASISSDGTNVKDTSIVFELIDLDTAYFENDDDDGATNFEGDDGGAIKSKVVPVDDDGFATVNIIDLKPESGIVRATGINEYSNLTQSTDIAFTTATGTLTLTPNPADFEAGTKGLKITITLLDPRKKPYKGDVYLALPSDTPAYFVGRNSNSIMVQTDKDTGTAEVTLDALTWCSGTMDANAKVNGAQVLKRLDFHSTVPEGLSIEVLDIAYELPSPPPTTQGAGGALTDDETQWVTGAGGGPATTSGMVRVRAQYMLNGKPWIGSGKMTFSVDATSNAGLSDDQNAKLEDLVKSVTVEYTGSGTTSKPETPSPATIYMVDGFIETVELKITGGKVGEITTAKDVKFGPAWAASSLSDMHFVGMGDRVAHIYKNSMHQAHIQISLDMSDAYGGDLTVHNQPTVEEVLARVQLVDFSSGSPYTVVGDNSNLNGKFGAVVVDTVPNYFDKQIAGAIQIGSAAAAVCPGVRLESTESTVADSKATLYYYLTFSNDPGRRPASSTDVGLYVDPSYGYEGGPDPYKFQYPNYSSSEKSLQIQAAPQIVYTLDNHTVVQTVTKRSISSQNDAGPSARAGNDSGLNYLRRWDAMVSIDTNNTAGKPHLFGAFMSSSTDKPDKTDETRETESFVFHNIKWGGYQTKAYFWQANNYILSKEDYADNYVDRGTLVTAPKDATSMTLDGLTPANVKPEDNPIMSEMNPPVIEANQICVTVVAGFGDLGGTGESKKWDPWKLKLVDNYGNVSGELQLNASVPQPAALLDAMANKWLPLDTNVSGTAPATLAGDGVMISRVTTVDDQHNDGGDEDSNMYFWAVDDKQKNLVGGYPLSAVSSTVQWKLSVLDGNVLNSDKLYKMYAAFKNDTYYILSYNPNKSDGDYPPVVGVTDVNEYDYVLLKPYWAQGAVMIYAVKKDATSTDGTYWQWTTATGVDSAPVMVFSHQYGTPVSQMGLWELDVAGQSQNIVPPPQK